jgi:hypothetical protein
MNDESCVQSSECESNVAINENSSVEIPMALSAVTPNAYSFKELALAFKPVGIEIAEEQGTAVLSAVLSFVKDGVYTKQAVVAKAKSIGIELGETLAIALVKTTLKWVKDSALKSENKADDILAVIIPLVEPKIYEALDKINPND